MAERFTSKEIVKIIDSLVGMTSPIGESNTDEIVEKNLMTLIDIVNWCLDGVVDAAGYRHRYEYSMRNVGQRAYAALFEWDEWIQNQIE